MRKVALLLLLSIAIAVGVLATGDVRQHLIVLWRHALASRPEITTNHEGLERTITSRYGSPQWRVHFIAGSKDTFPLATRLQRRSTLEKLGQAVVRESVDLSLATGQLPDGYRAVLTDAIADLQPRAGSARTTLASLGLAIAGKDVVADGEYLARLEAGQRALATLPNSDVLRSALWEFEFDAMVVSPYKRTFAVLSDPSYDLDGEWSRRAIASWDGSKAERVRISGAGAQGEEIIGYATRAARILEIDLRRPWLSDQLLDDLSKRSAQRLASHFSANSGALHLIPAKLWVRMGDEVLLEVSQEEDDLLLRQWVAQGVCCNISDGSYGEGFTLDPMTALVLRRGLFIARQRDDQPLLWAVISRRRGLTE